MLNDSCIGRGFYKGRTCNVAGNTCTNDCTGVREIDYENKMMRTPITPMWVKNNYDCYRSVHCKGQVYSEAIWSLYTR